MAGRVLWLALLGAGGGGLLIFLPLALGGLEWLVNFGVSKQLRIIKGSDTYELWRKPPIPIYAKFRIFNLTNPEEFINGSKPIVDEVGPYVYLETLEKVDITADEAADTVRYRQLHYYYFQPDMSNGSVDDMITFVNIPFVAVAKMAHEFTQEEFILEMLDSMLSEKGETLTKTHTVREFLFDGFSVQAFLDLLNDPMVSSAGEVEVPEMIKDGKMGLFKGKNGTSDGTWVVLTGKQNSKDLTRIQSYNDKKTMTVWKDPSCNSINGTDGMMFQPFLTKDTDLELFIGQMCRNLRYKNSGTITHRGIQVYNYRIPDSIYQSVENNPDNWCFCPEKNITDCNTNGIFHMGPCVQGAPMIISQPHFLGADSVLLDGVQGLQPDDEKHAGHIYVHPRSGATLEARHRFQFNVQVTQRPAMPSFAEVSTVLLPLMWMEEGANIDDKNKGMLSMLDTTLSIWAFLKWIMLLLCSILALAGGFLMNQANKADQTKSIETKLVPKESFT